MLVATTQPSRRYLRPDAAELPQLGVTARVPGLPEAEQPRLAAALRQLPRRLADVAGPVAEAELSQLRLHAVRRQRRHCGEGVERAAAVLGDGVAVPRTQLLHHGGDAAGENGVVSWE